MAVFWVVTQCRLVIYQRFIIMVEAAGASETLVNIYRSTRRNIPEDSHLHTRYRENFKSYEIFTL
jgi:hypothetical protein